MRLIVGVDNLQRPRRPQAIHQILYCSTPAATHHGRVSVKPISVPVARHLVHSQLADEPAENRCASSGQHQPERPPKRRDCQIRECRLHLTGARELYGLESVHETQQYEEQRDPGVALGQEAEDRSLEEHHVALLRATAGEHQSAGEAEDDVGGDDEERGNTAQALEKGQSSSVLQLCWKKSTGDVGTCISPAAVLHCILLSRWTQRRRVHQILCAVDNDADGRRHCPQGFEDDACTIYESNLFRIHRGGRRR